MHNKHANIEVCAKPNFEARYASARTKNIKSFRRAQKLQPLFGRLARVVPKQSTVASQNILFLQTGR